MNVAKPLPFKSVARFDHVVSLGCSCQAAYHVRRYTGVHHTLPFDWVGTPDPGLRFAIRTGLDGWFDAAQFKPDPTGGYRHQVTGMRFLHAFEKHLTFAEGHAAKSARMAQLLLRWFDLISSGQNVLFIREHGDEADPQVSARLLVETLLESVSVGFELLYLVPAARFDASWRMDGVKFVPHRKFGPDHEWFGYIDDWDGYFAALGVAKGEARNPLAETQRSAAAQADRD